jgi:hypothetical protein
VRDAHSQKEKEYMAILQEVQRDIATLRARIDEARHYL